VRGQGLLSGSALSACHNRGRIVVFRRLDHSFYSTFLTPMDNAPLASDSLDTHGLHHSATLLLSISRMHIDMLTPQAFRTVIGVAASLYVLAAMRTDKIFYCAGE
jgi:hypothetical protein